MHTHAERSQRGRQAPATSSGRGPAATSPGGAGAVPEIITEADATALQRSAGNRATIQRLHEGIVVQRYLGADSARAIADQLNEAMSGLGTDEEAIYGALAGRRGEDVREIRASYRRYGDLEADLRDELNDEEFERVHPALESVEEGPMTRATRETEAIFRAADAARELHDAMAGLGTEEDQIFNVLTGRTPTEIRQVLDNYLVDYGTPLEDDLRDELSGSDLERALQLIGRTDSGRVESREREQLVEGIDATVQGDFRYRLSETLLDVVAPVHFRPQRGCSAQLAAWNTAVGTTWNQFAFTEPGGRRVELRMAFAEEAGASRVIEVAPNANGSSYAAPDRANAGLFYQVTPDDTIAHEFGHLIGLPDEYQRTAEDYEVVTGEAAPSRTSVSPTGRTARQVADAINAALTGTGDAAAREQAVEGALAAAGMFAGNTPQQGEFAAEIRRVYDEAYGGAGGQALIPALQALPNNWWPTVVFSYASGTIMGNQGRYGLAPHEHPVMPRHLREFLTIVRNRWPDADWSIQ